MSSVVDNNYPVRLFKDIDTSHTNSQHNVKQSPQPIKPDVYIKNKTPTDVKFITKPDNFNKLQPHVIYPEDEELSPPVYRQVIDESRINIGGKFYNRSDLVGRIATR